MPDPSPRRKDAETVPAWTSEALNRPLLSVAIPSLRVTTVKEAAEKSSPVWTTLVRPAPSPKR